MTLSNSFDVLEGFAYSGHGSMSNIEKLLNRVELQQGDSVDDVFKMANILCHIGERFTKRQPE